MGNSFKQIREKAVEIRDEKLQKQMVMVSQLFNQLKIVHYKNINHLNVNEVVAKLNSGQITSEVLLVSLAYATGTIGAQLNLITFSNFQQAIKMARQCDKHRKRTGLKNWTFNDSGKNQSQFLPPLFGIPISIKDVYDIKGFPTTIGLKCRQSNVKADSVIILTLKNAGLIPFVKSNVPQYCMSAQTNNYLWGRAKNPWNQLRSSGGSSGGEGGLISSSCSIIGIGSDIGGSIRVPCQHSGVFGLKPSSQRISNRYHAQLSKVVTAISNVIPLCIGPLAKSSQDLALLIKTLTNEEYYQQLHDPFNKIIPFNNEKYLKYTKVNSRLKIGYINQFQCAQPSPTSQRALKQLVDILKEKGHNLVQIKIPHEDQLVREYLVQLTASKAEFLREILDSEKPTVENQFVINFQELGFIKRVFVQSYMKKYMKRAYYYSSSKKINSILDYQKHIGDVSYFKKQWVKYWKSQQLDFVICPGFPCQAIPHGQSNKLGYVLAYTFIWNILDMCVGSMPVTVVRQEQQYYDSKHDDIFTEQLKKCAKQSKGLPAGVQVVGLPFKEQQVLGFMQYLQKEIKFYEKHPLPDVAIVNQNHTHQID